MNLTMSELDQELGNYYIYIVWFRVVRFSNVYNFFLLSNVNQNTKEDFS